MKDEGGGRKVEVVGGGGEGTRGQVIWREPTLGRGKRIAQRTPRTQRSEAWRMRRLQGWRWRGLLLCGDT